MKFACTVIIGGNCYEVRLISDIFVAVRDAFGVSLTFMSWLFRKLA